MQISSREATPYEGPIPRAIEGLFLEIRWQILFCLAPPQPSQPPFFAQPGHETGRRSLAEDPQPIGGVTADFGRVDEGASPKASPPRPSSNRVYRFPVDGSPANFSAGLSSFEFISLWDIHPSDGRGAVAFAAQLFPDSGEEFIHSVFPGQHGFCHDTSKHRQAAEKRAIFRHASCSSSLLSYRLFRDSYLAHPSSFQGPKVTSEPSAKRRQRVAMRGQAHGGKHNSEVLMGPKGWTWSRSRLNRPEPARGSPKPGSRRRRGHARPSGGNRGPGTGKSVFHDRIPIDGES